MFSTIDKVYLIVYSRSVLHSLSKLSISHSLCSLWHQHPVPPTIVRLSTTWGGSLAFRNLSHGWHKMCNRDNKQACCCREKLRNKVVQLWIPAMCGISKLVPNEAATCATTLLVAERNSQQACLIDSHCASVTMNYPHREPCPKIQGENIKEE